MSFYFYNMNLKFVIEKNMKTALDQTCYYN